MESEFLIFCEERFHEGKRAEILKYRVVSSNGIEIGIHPLGRNSEGEYVEVLLIDGQPLRRNFQDTRLETLADQGRTHTRVQLTGIENR